MRVRHKHGWSEGRKGWVGVLGGWGVVGAGRVAVSKERERERAKMKEMEIGVSE